MTAVESEVEIDLGVLYFKLCWRKKIVVCTNILLDELNKHTKLQKLNFSIASVTSVCMGTAKRGQM